jgi:hypothetical protein
MSRYDAAQRSAKQYSEAECCEAHELWRIEAHSRAMNYNAAQVSEAYHKTLQLNAMQRNAA